MRVVQTTPGAGSAPRQPFGRATGTRAGKAPRPHLGPLRSAQAWADGRLLVAGREAAVLADPRSGLVEPFEFGKGKMG